MTKHPRTDSRLKRKFGNNGKTHSHLNLEAMMNLKHVYLQPETLAQNALNSQRKSSDKRTSIM